MSLTKVISNNVRCLRKQKHLSQLTLAYNSDISICCLRRIENGFTHMRLTKVKKIADALGVPLQQLFLPPKIDTDNSEKCSKVLIQNLESSEKHFLDWIAKLLRHDFRKEIDRIIKENTVEDNKQ